MSKKYIAREGGWFKPGTEVEYICEVFPDQLFPAVMKGLRICESENELRAVGTEYIDEESCSEWEFDVIEDTQ